MYTKRHCRQTNRRYKFVSLVNVGNPLSLLAGLVRLRRFSRVGLN